MRILIIAITISILFLQCEKTALGQTLSKEQSSRMLESIQIGGWQKPVDSSAKSVSQGNSGISSATTVAAPAPRFGQRQYRLDSVSESQGNTDAQRPSAFAVDSTGKIDMRNTDWNAYNQSRVSPNDVKKDFYQFYDPAKVDSVFNSLGVTTTRVQSSTLATIVYNRLNNSDDGRPVAVIVVAEADHNDAFSMKYAQYGVAPVDQAAVQLTNQGYRVMVYTAASESDMVSALQDGTSGGTCPASAIVIMGHGWQGGVNFGSGGEEASFDVGDVGEMQQAGVGNFLKSGGAVVILACSTGEGEDNQVNLGNQARVLFPQASQDKIFSPPWIAQNRFTFSFDGTGLINNVSFYNVNGEMGAYTSIYE